MRDTTLSSHINGIILGVAMFAETGDILASKMTEDTGHKWEWFITPTPDSVDALPDDYAISKPVEVGDTWGRLIIR